MHGFTFHFHPNRAFALETAAHCALYKYVAYIICKNTPSGIVEELDRDLDFFHLLTQLCTKVASGIYDPVGFLEFLTTARDFL